MSAMNNITKRMFRKIEGLVWNPLNGSVGIKKGDSIFTFAANETDGTGQVDDCPIASFGVSIPAYAMITPHDQVAVGDLVCGADTILGWVVSKADASYRLMDHTGHNKQYTLPKVTMAGIEGALVVKNLFGLAGGAAPGVALGGNLGMLMMLGMGDKMDDMLPMLLMSGSLGGAAPAVGAAVNPMASMLPLLLLSKNGGLGGAGGSSMDKLLPLMMMGGLGGAGAGAMNPLMMMALMGNGDLFGDNDPTPVRRVTPVSPPPLQRL